MSHPAAVKVKEKLKIPANGVLKLVGHGWGHGHGMSQWGAAGMAKDGKTYSQIMAFYYPHTSSTDVGNPTVKVGLESLAAQDAHNLHLKVSGSITFYNEASKKHHTYKSNLSWRVLRSDSRFVAQKKIGSRWVTKASFSGPIHVDTSTSTNHVTYPLDRTYTGYFRLVPVAGTSSHFMTVANVSMQSYLDGVVPAESISSWGQAALEAQAVAARTFERYHVAHPRSADYQVFDTTSDQVFGGTGVRTTATNAAVTATEGKIRTYGGAAILAQFSSSNGGWSTDGGEPYLIAQKDVYDGVVANSVHSWSASLPASALEHAYPGHGSLTAVTVTSRDGNGDLGGRVLTADLVFTGGTVSVTGQAIYQAYAWPAHSKGLRSSWWGEPAG